MGLARVDQRMNAQGSSANLTATCACLWVSGQSIRERHRQVGSLAGAAHLLNDNTGVLRLAQ